MNKRLMAHAGSFYSGDGKALEAMIHRFNHILDENPEVKWRLDMYVSYGIIVPHAGWIYSGFTANMAYRVLSGSMVDTVVVIGPSHRVGFEGISVSEAQLYETPLGDLTMDLSLVALLRERFGVRHYPQAHMEHSTEVQMPFIKHYLPDVKVVELVYGSIDPKQIEPILTHLLKSPKYGVVISTDLSHFYTLTEANEIDLICLNAVQRLDLEALHEGCEACGIIGVEAMMRAAIDADLEAVVLDYRTSADASGDESRVVGYMSAIFQDKI